jgi:long-chain acyl-CoA synthetase
MRSVPVNNDESHRVDPRFKNKLASQPHPGVETLYDLAKDAFKRYGARNCMGTREFLGWKNPKVKEFGGISWQSFSEVGVQAHKFGAALRSAGLQPSPPTTNLDKVTTPCRIAIFENTCADWMVACIGAMTQSICVATVYATLGIEAVIEAIEDNMIPVVVCNKKDVNKLVQDIKKMPSLKYIVYTNDLVAPTDKITLPSAPKGVKIVSFDDFCASGDVKAYPPTPPKSDTCAVVMYTSGVFM